MKAPTKRRKTACLVAVAAAGLLAFAAPGAHAQHVDGMSVSAANPAFANTFAGGQVVEVSVNSPSSGRTTPSGSRTSPS